MKYPIRAVKDLRAALRELEPQIRDPRHLRVGRDYPSFAMRPREFLGNWLLCAVLCHATGRDWTLSDDPLGGDGAILDRTQRTGFRTEHVFVPPPAAEGGPSVHDQLIAAVRAKASKGAEYARGVTLVVFSEAEGRWIPNRVGDALANVHEFEAVWAVGLESVDSGKYGYWVARLEPVTSQVWRVGLNTDFAEWTVERIQ